MDFHGVFIKQNCPMLKEHEIIVSNTGRNLAFAHRKVLQVKARDLESILQEKGGEKNQRILLWEVARYDPGEWVYFIYIFLSIFIFQL